MRWVRQGLPETDLDVHLLMLCLERSIVADKLVGSETVVRFHFTDLAIAENKMKLVGPKNLTGNVSSWIQGSIFEGIAPAQAINYSI